MSELRHRALDLVARFAVDLLVLAFVAALVFGRPTKIGYGPLPWIFAGLTALLTLALLALVVPRLRGPNRFGALVLLGTTLAAAWGLVLGLAVSDAPVFVYAAFLGVPFAISGMRAELRHRARENRARGRVGEVFE